MACAGPRAPRGISEQPRTDLAAFSHRVLGLRLWPHLIEAANSVRFITVIAKGEVRERMDTNLGEAAAAVA